MVLSQNRAFGVRAIGRKVLGEWGTTGKLFSAFLVFKARTLLPDIRLEEEQVCIAQDCFHPKVCNGRPP